ncbi:hypothetical protein AGMMS49975_10440 [Clostridia bacterium]|nr:hypothetical protein AGMMS49975_10440 [Clostridia bacterium]
MVKQFPKPHKMSQDEIDNNYHGYHVLLEREGLSPLEDAGFVVAIGETSEDVVWMDENICGNMKRVMMVFGDRDRNKAIVSVL